MANYPLLRKADNLPSVGVLQLLLNRTGASLSVDGSFGDKTELALKRFQSARSLSVSGVVDADTWIRLSFAVRLPLVDCIDVFHPRILQQRAQKLQSVGAAPILTGGMQLGVNSVISRLRGYGGGIFLLRMVGHGAPGKQAVSYGAGGWDEWDTATQKMKWHPFQSPASDFSGVGLSRSSLNAFVPIRDQLGPYGNLELHGCQVGQGHEGHRFVSELALKLGAPVSAGIGRQPMQSAFRIVGPVFSAFPTGHNLRSWCKSLPEFTPVTVP